MSLPQAFGRYHVLQQLGRGGMGTVYKVRADDGRVLALKVLNQASLDVSHRFKREFRAASKLKHDNIVGVYELFEDGAPYITMEFVEGTDLIRFLHDGGPTGPCTKPEQLRKLFFCLGQVLKAIDYIHAHGIVHRDLKPDNILVNREGAVKIMDFGLAKLENADSFVTSHGMIMGTVAYAAPEQIAGGSVDARADLYALGVILYQALTGRLPIGGKDVVTLIRAKLLGDPPPAPSSLNSALDPGWDPVVMRLLEREPAQRYPLIADLMRDLRELWGGALGKKKKDPPLDESKLHSRGMSTLRPARFVGRSTELEKLSAALDSALRGEPRLVFLRGEPGVGKTRLIEELRGRARVKGVRVVSGHASPSPIPYGHFLPVLDRMADRLRGWSHAEVASAVTAEGAALAFLAPRFLRVPGIQALPAARALPPREARDRDFRVIASLFRAMSERGATLLVLEDFHQADAASLALFDHLSGQLASDDRGLKLVILASYRSDSSGDDAPTGALLRGRAATLGLRLETLGKAEVQAFVASMLGGVEPEPKLRDRLHAASRGNPLVLEQTVKKLVEAGALVSEAGAWRFVPESVERVLPAARTAARQVPKDLGEAVRDRIAGLAPRTRQVLELGALAGLSFRVPVLALASERGEDRVLDAIEEGLRQQVLSEPSRAEQPYTFLHEGLEQQLLAGIPPARARRLHGAVAEALEKLGTAGAEELARHFDLAGNVEKAAEHLPRAARAVAARFDNHRALELYARAILALEKLPRSARPAQLLVDLRLEAGTVAELAGDLDRALGLVTDAARLARSVGLRNRVAAALAAEAWLRWVRSRYDEAHSLAAEALALARECGDAGVEARALDVLGLVARRREQFDDAQEYFRAALPIKARAGSMLGIADTLVNLSIVARKQSRIGKAQMTAKVALVLYERSGHRRGVAHATAQIGAVHLAVGEFAEAEQRYQQALRQDVEIGNYRGAALDCSSLGTVKLMLGDYPEAEVRFQQALETFHGIGDVQNEGLTLLNLGHAAFRSSAPLMARGFYRKGLALLRGLEDRSGQSEALSALAAVEAELGNRKEAERLGKRALRFARDVGQPHKEAWASLTLARVLDDELAASRAVELAERAGDPNVLFQALYRLSVVARRAGDAPRAADALRRAKATIHELAKSLPAAREAFLARPAVREVLRAHEA